jgi:dihydrofolate reductase
VKISVVAATGENRVIGSKGKIPWRLPADLKRFKELTMGHPVLMGRKTFESIGKPLPGRINIVITSDPRYKAEGCIVVHSFPDALRAAENKLAGDSSEVFVIGGAQVYATALPRAQTIYLTKVHGAFKGDAFFPEFSESEWHLVRSEPHEKDEKNPFAYDFLTYEREEGSRG